MKLSELKQIIDDQLEHALPHEDDTVRIAIKLPYQTVGAIPMVEVKSAHSGFDWENGCFILYPEEELTPTDRDFAEKMRKMQEDLGWVQYENRNLKAEIKKLKAKLR